MTPVPPPTDAAFDGPPVVFVMRNPWKRHGAWRFREFGQETQLRCDALPHLALDLWRSEAEALYAALGEMLSQPAPMPYRVPWWTRLRQWGERAVWRRKHHQAMERARAELTDHFIRRGPWP